ncbi:peptidyl-prolyl cis-trans isomerase [Nannocystis sp. SCPEA4]|uniref:peptidyl-prolyl cis-trans isomerase n=1 Tax=Nannocystis sp. SCPEA4 TaxID=2996787 RepID=UPI002271B48F|nr:peptidyl-prolyl cis-trans isomerase [Nannocystis sp. SCPEA4]MCY1055165.1 peptidyl-prolyl cis-trans isomerase [Nannocystis sp. SCPEA4]
MRRVARVAALVVAGFIAVPEGPARAEGMVLDKIVAVVGDEIILLSQLDTLVASSPLMQEALQKYGRNPTKQQIEQATLEARTQALDELIDQQLIKKEAARFQISITDADVERYLQQIAQENGFSNTKQLREAVEQSGQYGNWADYIQDTKDQLLVYQTTRALANTSVTDAQIREQYRKMVRGVDIKADLLRFVFTPEEQTAKARDAAYSNAQAVARRMRAGEDPMALAQEFLIKEPKATLSRGEVAPAIEDAIFAARVGETVGPLETGQGYLVVKVVRHETGNVLPFDQAKERIRMQLEQESFARAVKDLRASLRAKTHIDPRL